MLENSWLVAQVAASQEWFYSMKLVSYAEFFRNNFYRNCVATMSLSSMITLWNTSFLMQRQKELFWKMLITIAEYPQISPSKLRQEVTLLTCIREVSQSRFEPCTSRIKIHGVASRPTCSVIFSWKLTIVTEGFRYYPQFLQANTGIITQIMRPLLPSRYFINHYSLISPPVSVVRLRYCLTN
jgi:hypothetical protein